MSTLVVGASGATGRLLVEQLLEQGGRVKIIVRSIESVPALFRRHSQLTITVASLLDMTDAQLLEQVQGCRAVVSCLGHNLTFKGIFGHPRRLVTTGAQRLCQAIERTSPDTPVKFVLMNTTGNQNHVAGETISKAQDYVIRLIRQLVPPHADNEEAAECLQKNYGETQTAIEWTAVRPDSLIDEETVSEYNIYPSPIRSAIFDAGKTSRINVAHFMARLILESDIDHGIWQQWKRQMPVIYNV
jgi:nucleoside-diphosphate-sugar epimerase